MKRWISRALVSTLCLAGCVLWTGCGGGGGTTAVVAATDVRYVRAAESPGTIHLSWTPNSASDILGYTVTRRPAGSETYVPVANQLIRDTTFTDQLAEPDDNRTMFYQVIAVGTKGQLGTPAEVTAIVSPPIPPSGF